MITVTKTPGSRADLCHGKKSRHPAESCALESVRQLLSKVGLQTRWVGFMHNRNLPNTMKEKVSFNELIQSKRPVLVDFSAEWCGPCRAMAPILQEVAREVGDRARIVKIDVDRNPQLAQKMQIVGVPTLMVFQNGEVKWRQSGMQSAYQLTHVLDQFAAEAEITEE